MAKVVKNNLGYLGEDFQFKLISTFFNEHKFFKDLAPIIDQNMFTEAYLRTIVGVLKDYYDKYEGVPSYETVIPLLNDKATNEDDIQYYKETIDKLRDTSTEGVDVIREMSEKFFKQQNLVRVANEIKRIAGDGDMSRYDECQKLVEDALSIGCHDVEVSSPLDDIDDDLSKENIVTIPTGVDALDDCLGGGLDKGKIGLIMAPMGTGKTSLTTAFDAYAATYRCEQNNNRGFKVLQIVFEDTKRDVHRKYFSKLTGVETCKLNESEETTEMVRGLLKTHPDKDLIKNNIRIMRLQSGQFSATEIKAKIKKLTNEGFKPDVVSIDYLECVKHESGTYALPKHERENITMRCFENYAAELDIALWLPTQGNRDSISAEVVTMDQGSGSIGKQQIAQVVMSIARTVEDLENKRATLSVLKNRGGNAGRVFNGIHFDNGTCTINCDNVIVFDKMLEYEEHVESVEDKLKHDKVMELLNE